MSANFKIQGNRLILPKETIQFDTKIQKALEFDNFVVILTNYSTTEIIENVICFDYDGNKKWQIQALDTIDNPYSNIVKIDNYTVKLINWDGTDLLIDSYTGHVKLSPMDSRRGKRPW